ncbi:hypothetical protein HPB51_028421 [Rhipicephalus microplus]|uniref:DDE Tnp4 domain-containing protein n=1 Tax=Rhipicephalus microplus TaxID=6941 RepID=A0A9J6CX40_RHIMP|nr:hypothetical protein HPB51_028421 [Rhipicephalus microplus]
MLLQAVAGPELQFFDNVAGWPGSVQDSRIFDNSRLQVLYEENRVPGVLLGDARYACQPYLFIPFSEPGPTDTPKGSFDRPLSFIAEVLEKCGHPWTRSVFARVVQVCQGVIDSKFGRLASAENKRDDLIRKTLSVLEDSIAATSPVAKVMFSGMSTLSGPRGWDRESVVSSVRDWVTGETTLFSGEGQRGEVATLLNEWMPKWVGQGVLGDARKLGFEE